jgi:hypothetical protein
MNPHAGEMVLSISNGCTACRRLDGVVLGEHGGTIRSIERTVGQALLKKKKKKKKKKLQAGKLGWHGVA